MVEEVAGVVVAVQALMLHAPRVTPIVRRTSNPTTVRHPAPATAGPTGFVTFLVSLCVIKKVYCFIEFNNVM